jgi:hypothetical protein
MLCKLQSLCLMPPTFPVPLLCIQSLCEAALRSESSLRSCQLAAASIRIPVHATSKPKGKQKRKKKRAAGGIRTPQSVCTSTMTADTDASPTLNIMMHCQDAKKENYLNPSSPPCYHSLAVVLQRAPYFRSSGYLICTVCHLGCCSVQGPATTVQGWRCV